MLEQVEFKDFRIGELFEIFTIPQIPRNFMIEVKESKLSDDFFPYITQKKNDNGIAGYIRKTDVLPLIQKPVILLGVDNVSNGVCFYHNEPFYANKMIALHHEELNRKTALYFISCILKQYSNYSYSRKISLEIIKRTTIPLPVTSSGTPNYSYMESYISYIEKLHVANIQQAHTLRIERILKELGYNSLKDAELTAEDKEILRLFSEGELTLAEFKIGELFEIYLSRGDNKISNLEKGNVPLVSSGISDNGIVGHVKSGDDDSQLFSKNSMTVDMFGNCFTQVQDFYAVSHGRVNILNLKNNSSAKILLYICSTLNKSTQNSIYGFSNMLSSRKLANLTIPLPTNPQSPTIPHYSLMESYITAIEKLHVNKLISSHNQEITMLNTVT